MRAILNVVKKLSRRVEVVRGRLKYLRNLRDAITPQLDGLPRSPNVSKKVEWLTVTAADLENKLLELSAVLIECQVELCKMIFEKIDDGEIGRVIFHRYGLLKKFSEIAAEMHYSEAVIFRLHRLGLKILGVQPSLFNEE